ncbi:MAG: tRNA dihydrouridine synthase DusB [Thermodesulfovibrio sp.]|nr:tRNA dihydrouridine synthase DusB [Thermodesulfovibrio sp.]
MWPLSRESPTGGFRRDTGDQSGPHQDRTSTETQKAEKRSSLPYPRCNIPSGDDQLCQPYDSIRTIRCIISAVLSIGKNIIPSACLLAPLAGISDLPFRLINREHGCEFAFTEMISARSLVYDSRKSLEMLTRAPGDTPLGLQLLGSDPEVLARATELVNEMKDIALIDFNAACPVHKVVSKGEGSALMKEPKRLKEILEAIVRHTGLPVTVKIRAGWDDTSVNAAAVALCAEDAGISGLTIHGRTREQGYQGRVDYDVIAQVKKALRIPLIASGDALSPVLIKKMFDETACDGVAIARGALGNPWIFRETEHYLKTGCIPERPSLMELQRVMLQHLGMQCELFGEIRGTVMFRKLFSWYVKSLWNIKKLREKAFHALTKTQMTAIIQELENPRH